MPLAGTPIIPRKFARVLFDHGWTNVENLAKMVATCLAESNLYSHAWHYNDPREGGDGSTDWGPFQLNDGNRGGVSPVSGADGLPQPRPGGSKTLAEVMAFRDMACDHTRAVLVARDLYDRRGFQPWVAYNTEAWKRHAATATYAVRNMLHEKWGIPLA